MNKNIVLLSDGTGNSSRALFKSNVWRLYQALDLTRPDQIALYDDGVGSSSFRPLALIGGAFGYGLKRNVLDLYTFLCRNYQPEDRIYCFGFSRGAFTVRVLAGLIANQGLVQAGNEIERKRLAKAAFRAYRRRYRRKHLDVLRWLRDLMIRGWNQDYDKAPKIQTDIAFLGVWDTVAAYGLPIDELTHAWNYIFPLSFPDRDLNDKVQRACHALALDDERHSFHPELWNEVEERDLRAAAGQSKEQAAERKPLHERLLQVWFAGMHSNVGGSYPDDAMAYVPLDWMMGEAERAGLHFKPGEHAKVKAAANIHGPMYDSRRGVGGAYRYRPRKLDELTDDKEFDVRIPFPKIHESVFERIREGTNGYAPIVLPARYALYTKEGEVHWQDKDEQVRQAHCTKEGKMEEVAAQPVKWPEHPTQARNRRQAAEKVWDLVWKKRVVYFATVAAGFALALFPLYRHATETCGGPACSIAPLIRSLGLFLPSLAAPWLKAYESHPGSFLALLLLMVLLIYQGDKYQHKIFDRMRAIWKPILAAPGPASEQAPEPASRIQRLRTNAGYQSSVKFLKSWVLVPLAGITAALALVFSGSRIVFTMFESAGCVCRPSASTTPISEQSKIFSIRNLCWASGWEVQEGKRYKLTLTINNAWLDNTIPSGIGGYSKEKMTPLMYPGTLLRRQIGEPWFKPIARIGYQGRDEYPLNPSDGSQPGADSTQLVAEITARRSGELFLYLNDAILPVPNDWQYFYNNNGEGSATVKIELVNSQ